MSMEGTPGAASSIKLEQFYPGMDDKHTLNSEGEFVSRRVRKLENTVSKLRGTKGRTAHQVQSHIQTSVYNRRAELLKKHGDFKTATAQLEVYPFNNRQGKLDVLTDREMEAQIDGIKSIADSADASKEIRGKAAVSPGKLKARAQKDLTIFFANGIKSARSPHVVCTLNHHIGKELQAGAITQDQANKLLGELEGKCKALAEALPQKLAELSILEGEKDQDSLHKAETRKLEYLHELTVTLRILAPTQLEAHRETIRKEAMNAFETGTNHLSAHGDNLEITSARLKAITGNQEDLLAPILQDVSSKPAKRMQQAIQATRTTVNTITRQLEDIPRLIKEQGQLLTGIQKVQKELAQVALQLKSCTRDLQQREAELAELRKNTGSKLKRRFNLSYQFKSRDIRKAVKRLKNRQKAIQESGNSKLGQIRQLKRKHSSNHGLITEKQQQFKDSLHILELTDQVTLADISNTLHGRQLLELQKNEHIQDIDVISANKYFSDLLDAGVPAKSIEKMMKEYSNLVKNHACDSSQAIWVIASSHNLLDASDLPPGCTKTLQLFRDNTWLPKLRTDQKPQVEEVSVPFRRRFAGQLSGFMTSGTSAISSTTALKMVVQAIGEHPEMEESIQEVAQFFTEGLENDGKAFVNTDFDELYNEYCGALDLGLKALTEEGVDVDTAYERMRDFLEPE